MHSLPYLTNHKPVSSTLQYFVCSPVTTDIHTFVNIIWHDSDQSSNGILTHDSTFSNEGGPVRALSSTSSLHRHLVIPPDRRKYRAFRLPKPIHARRTVLMALVTSSSIPNRILISCAQHCKRMSRHTESLGDRYLDGVILRDLDLFSNFYLIQEASNSIYHH